MKCSYSCILGNNCFQCPIHLRWRHTSSALYFLCGEEKGKRLSHTRMYIVILQRYIQKCLHVVQVYKAQQANLWQRRKIGVSSSSSNTYAVTPASSARITPGLLAGDKMIAHTDWRCLVCTLSDWASPWWGVHGTNKRVPNLSPLDKAWAFAEDTRNTRTWELDINRACSIFGGFRKDQSWHCIHSSEYISLPPWWEQGANVNNLPSGQSPLTPLYFPPGPM